jgi:hypothetical protein
MNRAEPPRVARWLLEHCVPGDTVDALAGDLLEELRDGRSREWYTRQVASAMVIGWVRVLGARGMLIIFAVLWSLLAPAWTVILDHLVSRPNPAQEFWRMDAPFSGLASFGLWLALNIAFLWAGMLVYFGSYASFAKAFSRGDVVRAVLVAGPIFLLAYFGAFVAANLLMYPGPAIPRRTMTAAGEFFDPHLGAFALRLPYFATLLCALWDARPRFEFGLRESSLAAVFDAGDSTMFHSDQSGRSPATLVRFLVLCGLVNTLIVAVLLCRLPATHTPTLGHMLFRAAVYVALGALAGTVGAWAYWRRAVSSGASMPLPFRLFALLCAAGWVWVPAIVLLAAQEAPAAAFVAALASGLLAVGLRRAIPLLTELPEEDPDSRQLFAATLRTPRREVQGYVIAGCIYLAGFALNDREHLAASGLLALSAFLFVWQLTQAPPRPVHARFGNTRASLRLVRVAIPAVLVTLWALFDGIAYRDRGGESNTASAHGNSNSASGAKPTYFDAANALDGYESIVLWPEPPKKEIVAPIPLAPEPKDPRLEKPLVLRFNGAYWYFQPPSHKPGPHAHVSHGSPLAVDIHSTSYIPLTMEAHQTLARPLHLNCCGSIEVEIQNRDNRAGALSLAMVLVDNTAPGKPSLYLGAQPIASSQSDRFQIKATPVTETLRFELPAHAPLKQFDEISLVVITDPVRMDIGARIAIAQFELQPRGSF